MPQAELDAEMLAAMRGKIGTGLRIDHSVNNDYASRVAVAKFAGGIGDINPLWTDVEYGKRSPLGAPGAPPSLVIGGFPGLTLRGVGLSRGVSSGPRPARLLGRSGYRWLRVCRLGRAPTEPLRRPDGDRSLH